MLIGHSNTPEGRERSRRIFSTLNRYVKPVRLGDIIALDEDDVVAIVTRDMLEAYPLFMGNRIKVSNSKSIPKEDKQSFTSLMTLYDCHKALFHAYITNKEHKKYTQSQLKDYLRCRPTDSIIEEYKNELIDFWNCMRNTFSEIHEYINDNSNDAAALLRSSQNGGNIFFRPIGLFPFVESVVRIKQHDYTIPFGNIVDRYANMERVVSNEPWNHILWNPLTNKMLMRNQTLVKYILINMYSGSLLSEKERDEMVKKYATIFNIDLQEAEQRISEITL
jgi:DNA sulfur modification protein DndB